MLLSLLRRLIPLFDDEGATLLPPPNEGSTWRVPAQLLTYAVPEPDRAFVVRGQLWLYEVRP
jgi:hypothetical protein